MLRRGRRSRGGPVAALGRAGLGGNREAMRGKSRVTRGKCVWGFSRVRERACGQDLALPSQVPAWRGNTCYATQQNFPPLSSALKVQLCPGPPPSPGRQRSLRAHSRFPVVPRAPSALPPQLAGVAAWRQRRQPCRRCLVIRTRVQGGFRPLAGGPRQSPGAGREGVHRNALGWGRWGRSWGVIR